MTNNLLLVPILLVIFSCTSLVLTVIYLIIEEKGRERNRRIDIIVMKIQHLAETGLPAPKSFLNDLIENLESLRV